MTGLDHTSANLEIREKFAITKEKTQRILASLVNKGIAGGCVAITTCNRTELYLTVAEYGFIDPAKLLCDELGGGYGEYGHLFTQRAGDYALEHLCRMASGLDSQVMGDDQVITQVREALELSRQAGCTDSYIETMFNTAIQAAKAIKTNVVLRTLGIDSVPGKTIEKLSEATSLGGINAVVIGNGQMGRLMAELLVQENANVSVTVRQYKRGEVQVPDMACAISYADRYRSIQEADLVISATTSPHYTLSYDEIARLGSRARIFVDLAVPRDIDPQVAQIPGATLYTIDDISGGQIELPRESILTIESIVSDHISKYWRWLMYKDRALAKAATGGMT